MAGVILWNSESYILDQEEAGMGVGRIRAAIEGPPIVSHIVRSVHPGCVPLPDILEEDGWFEADLDG